MSLRNTLLLSLSLFLTQTVCAEILFEGFYRIERKGKHVGYVMQRLSSEPKAGTKTLTSYMRVLQDDKELYESTKSVAKVGTGSPVSTSYTTTTLGNPVTITTQYNGAKGKASFYSDRKRKPERVENLKAAAHSSSFIFYLADISKMSPNKNYEYTALTEERGRIGVGILNFVTAKTVQGAKIVHVVDDFLGQPSENFIAEGGEPLGSRSPVEDVICYWVATKAEAMGELQFPTAEMTSLFGDLPEGTKNPWSKIPGFKAYDAIRSFASNPGARAVSSEKIVKERTPMPERKI